VQQVLPQCALEQNRYASTHHADATAQRSAILRDKLNVRKAAAGLPGAAAKDIPILLRHQLYRFHCAESLEALGQMLRPDVSWQTTNVETHVF
jgi:hypothetical protein